MSNQAHITEEKGAESPTTRAELDFDDEQETGVIDASGQSHQTPTKPPRSSSLKPHNNVRFAENEEQAPAKPPRPESPNTQNEKTLAEAFPAIERQVIRAVLMASGGQVEPAFNALLSMSDPDAAGGETPVQPPRSGKTQQEQQDEMYARQLQEHYASMSRPQQQQQRQQQQQAYGQGPNQQQRPNYDDDDRDYSFFEDDLPRIRENMRQGFQTTQNRFNSWINDLRKRIDGEDDDLPEDRPDQPPRPQRSNFGPSQREQMYGIQKQAERQRQQQQQGGVGRRSVDQERYDSDPHVLSDNLRELELQDNELYEDERPPPKPARPAANPNLFKPTPATPKGPIDEVEAVNVSSGSKSKKWQPLTNVAPQAEADDNDPFSLGDSEDEKEKERVKSVDLKKEDTERLKKAASEIEKDNKQEDNGAKVEKKLEAAERSGSIGTRDKAAEELMKGETSDDKKNEKTETDKKAEKAETEKEDEKTETDKEDDKTKTEKKDEKKETGKKVENKKEEAKDEKSDDKKTSDDKKSNKGAKSSDTSKTKSDSPKKTTAAKKSSGKAGD